MSWFFVLLVNTVITITMIDVMSSEGANRGSNQIERPIMIRMRDIDFPRSANVMFTGSSSSLFFLHLFKYKPQIQYQKLDKIPTTTPMARDCICVPFYLCDDNQTVITDGTGVINPRVRICTGDFEVCCYLRNATIPPTIPTIPPTIPTIPPTTPTMPPTMPPTIPPIVFPTNTPSPPVTGFPNLNCICVVISLCNPSGVVIFAGEGVLIPRQQNILCPGANLVCCMILANVTQPTIPPTMMPTTTTISPTTAPPGQTQLCFVCGNTVQCFTCAIIITPGGGGMIDPRFSQILSEGNICAAASLPTCQNTMMKPITELLGRLKNPNTPQACYCVKTWLCSAGNAVSPDGLGIIDSRFTACSSPDEVCCRLAGIDLLRNIGKRSSAPALESFTVKGRSDHSFPQINCGIQNNSYAPSQPFSADSGKTYFAEFPWMVALLVKSAISGPYTFKCGASIISNAAIITAAHCVINEKPENLVARFGQWNIENSIQPLPIQEANIFTIVVHPLYYSGGLFHDVAVLVLEKPITYSANVFPICLPEQGMVFPTGARCYGIGWGSNSFEGKYQAELRKIDLPIVDRTDCQTRLRSTKLGQYFQLHGSFICAGGEANRDTCRGDGGGPLACQATTGQFFQAGIVSWGIDCGVSNIPAVYSSVSQHRQWIDQQLATYGV
nr:PREDICTED: suppressor of tumorigenicity 14 protein-like [Linepithema humile]